MSIAIDIRIPIASVSLGIDCVTPSQQRNDAAVALQNQGMEQLVDTASAMLRGQPGTLNALLNSASPLDRFTACGD